MESLPLELHEQVFSYLLPPFRDWTNIVAVPVSTRTARFDIYNLRLVSRRINRAAVHPFVQIIGDIPTKCTAKSLSVLANLLKSANVARDVNCLTFDVCKLYVTETQTLSQLSAKCENHDEWIQAGLSNDVQAILHETPKLRHLVLLPGAARVSAILSFREIQRIRLAMMVKEISEPMLYIQRALESTKVNENLETITILKLNYANFDEEAIAGNYEEAPASYEIPPIEYPRLTHLTVSPSSSELSGFRVCSPNLTTLLIILDNRGDAFDTGSAECLPVDSIRSGLHSLVLSGDGYQVNTALLLQCIVPATNKIESLPLLTIRDMLIIMDINYGVEQLPGEGRFKELLFENVKYCFTDEITLSGPSGPTELDNKWKALPRLCERADRVRLKMGDVERVLEPFEWDDKEEGI